MALFSLRIPLRRLKSGFIFVSTCGDYVTVKKYVNVNWPLIHYRTAVHYLAKGTGEEKGTGGTNWQKYLPPRFQRRIFYPELWTEQEIKDWGKNWVENVLE